MKLNARLDELTSDERAWVERLVNRLASLHPDERHELMRLIDDAKDEAFRKG